MKTPIQIDPGAGPCFGVQRAIDMAEDLLNGQDQLACLGDLIHNDEEIRRLEGKGLQLVSHCQLVEQSGKKMLIRAHGEPPSTFRIAARYEVDLIDATCPIVKRLQKKVEKACIQMLKQKGQVLVFGDLHHAEMHALKGYAKGEFHIVQNESDLKSLDSKKNTILFSQTTKYQSDYKKLVLAFEKKRKKEKAQEFSFAFVESTCKHVAKRDAQMIDFLRKKDVLVFVSGKKSSNGKHLFQVGRKKLRKSHFISSPNEIKSNWFKPGQSIGISSATSTPRWLLEDTYAHLQALINKYSAVNNNRKAKRSS